MKITYRCDYALKAVLELAICHGQGVVTINEIAKRIDTPVKFLEQILLDLKKGGFIESRRGKVGGYLLAKPADKITVGDVIRFIEGPLEPIGCLRKGYADCPDVSSCVFKPVWQRVSSAISGVVDHTNFAQLAGQAAGFHKQAAYSI